VLIPEVRRISETAISPLSAQSRVSRSHLQARALAVHHWEDRGGLSCTTLAAHHLLSIASSVWPRGKSHADVDFPSHSSAGSLGGAVVWRCSLVRLQGRRGQALRPCIPAIPAADGAWEVDGLELRLLRRLRAQTLASVSTPWPQAILTAEGRRSLQH